MKANSKPNCPGCAAIWTAQRLFPLIEDFARRQDAEPDEMQAVLTELLAMWVAINAGFHLDEGTATPPLDARLLATVTEYTQAMRHHARRLPVSLEFKAAAETPRHRH